MKIKMPINTTLLSNLTPTDVHIFYEDKTPYLEYTGVAETNKGKIKFHFPKVDLSFNAIEIEEERCDRLPYFANYLLKQNICIKNDIWTDFEFIDRKMTKEEIEKELGYKVEIVK